MEATGRMHRALRQSLHDRGFAVLAVNPRQSRDFAKAAGDMAKTDRVDARVLAAFGAAFPARPPTAPAEAAIDRLRDMLVLRERLVDQRTQLKAVFDEVGDPDPDGPSRRSSRRSRPASAIGTTGGSRRRSQARRSLPGAATS